MVMLVLTMTVALIFTNNIHISIELNHSKAKKFRLGKGNIKKGPLDRLFLAHSATYSKPSLESGGKATSCLPNYVYSTIECLYFMKKNWIDKGGWFSLKQCFCFCLISVNYGKSFKGSFIRNHQALKCGHPITARHFIEEGTNVFCKAGNRESLRHRSKEKACHVPHMHHVLQSLGSQLYSTIGCL